MKHFLGAVALVALLGALAAPASVAAGPTPVYYVALGDSLATGAQPAASGETAALRAANGTNRGYVDVLYDALRAGTPNLHLVNLGCGGESTASMLTGGTPFDYRCGYGKSSQLEQAVSFLEEHAGRIAFVTIDIGANDLLATGGGGVPAIAQNLPTILDAVRDAAGPTVRIVGMNYYDPFVAAVWFETQSIAALQAEVASTAGLNDFLEGIYATFDMPVADVESAFQLHDFTLVDGTPLNVVRACQWTWMCAVGDIHANDDGYRVIAEAFLTVVS